MTESGEIGLGEINAMRSTENGLSGRQSLMAAYQKAADACR